MDSKRFSPYKAMGGNSIKSDGLSELDLLLPLIASSMIPKSHHSTHNDKIFRRNNHIYFRDDVTQKNVDLLISLINSYRDEMKERNSGGKSRKTKTIKPIYLHICSNGGSIYAGYIAYDYIKMSKIPIYTVAEGMVASMATTISIAGKKRYMLPSAVMLVHQLRTKITGTYDQLCDEHENLQKIMDYDIAIYLKECRGKATTEQIRDMLSHERIIDFAKCLEYGFVDEEYKGQQ